MCPYVTTGAGVAIFMTWYALSPEVEKDFNNYFESLGR